MIHGLRLSAGCYNRPPNRSGGSIEKRARFHREVVEAVAAEWPARRVGVRISPNGVFNDMGSPNFREHFTHVATMLDRCGLAYLHVVDGLAFGRTFISNPDLVARLRHGWPLAEPAEMAVWYSPTGAGGYTDFPAYVPG